ncbi:asparagine synthase (glutamine-hydrolyzing) [Stappia sp. 22II-S9-Z10]|nr:asparagine synthase (glutamine-hydrolyzing) [Stappia sp. 22II-S9-Z10]
MDIRLADFLLAIKPTVTPELLRQAMVVGAQARLTAEAFEGGAFATARIDDAQLWDGAAAPEAGARLILAGRIALSAGEWDAAERLDPTGGLAARHLLHQALAHGQDGLVDYNGAATVILLDERAGEGTLVTDRLGAHPAFATVDGPLVVGSHPDAVAAVRAALGHPLAIDPVTAAELMCSGTSTHPHTHWRGLAQLDNGAVYRFPLREAQRLDKRTTYWTPAVLAGAEPLSHDAFVENLAEAMKTAGRLRSVNRLGPPAVLLSAGADSRAVLFSLSDPAAATAFTYYDVENPELIRARELAALAGARHVALQRSQDYYLAGAPESVRLSGGMWSIESGHHTGFVDAIRNAAKPGTLLTGCYADYLLKGIALSVKPRTIYGRSLPLMRLAPLEYPFHHAFCDLAPEAGRLVKARLAARFDAAFATGDRYAVEALRILPMCREADASGRLSLWRQLPVDPFMADRNILEAYGQQSIADKLSGIAFGQAVARVVGPRAAAVPNNNYNAPVGTGAVRRVAAFAGSSARRKTARLLLPPQDFQRSPIATYGSWPDLAEVLMRTDMAADWFGEIRRGDLMEMVPQERRAWSLEAYARRDLAQVLRLITLHLWREAVAGANRRVGVAASDGV